MHYWKTLKKTVKAVPGKSLCNPKFVFSFLIIMLISSSGVWAPWAFNIDLSSVCNTEVESFNDLSLYKYNEKNSVELGGYFIGIGETTSTSISQPINDLNLIKSLNDSCQYISSLPIILFQGFAIFMFNLGLLGGIAFEFFVGQGPKKYEDLNFDEKEINKMRINEFAGFFAWLLAFVLSFYGLKEPTTTSVLSLFGSVISVSLWICTNYNKAQFQEPEPNPENIEAGANDNTSNDEQSNLSGENLE
ncbi:hypothetical protein ACLKMH_12965 [Psychromonas sp. KJ10-10]|uniref:hypothetical protein n=1 Tax=Psychromonas sp. KJ10-10 TaxID=3391823 RepID=UPI0039B3ABF7